uniref:Putative secreted peptide n=1 Tax=Anopheles braziliensis TaxID=58242 RepID=A0A2M3ZPF5_9DIPT
MFWRALSFSSSEHLISRLFSSACSFSMLSLARSAESSAAFSAVSRALVRLRSVVQLDVSSLSMDASTTLFTSSV